MRARRSAARGCNISDEFVEGVVLMLSFYLSACALLAAFFAAGVMLGRGGAKKDYSLGGRKAGAAGVTGILLGSLVGGASTVGTVQMAYSDGMTAVTEKMYYDGNKAKAYADTPVKADGYFGNLEAEGFEYYKDKKMMVFTGKSKIVIKQDNGGEKK